MSIETVLVNPGERSKVHYHKKMKEIYYIIEGNGEVVINIEKHAL